MSGDRHDVGSEIVLPAGMEIVVPPAATKRTATAPRTGRGADESSEPEVERAILPPFVHRGELRRAPAL